MALKKEILKKIETHAPNNKLTAAEINTLCIQLTQNSSYELSYYFIWILIFVSGLAYMFNTWFNLALITSLPFLSLFVYWWVILDCSQFQLKWSFNIYS